MPFSYTFVFVALKPPGTTPPMSRWCAFRLTNPTISPPWKTGREKRMSFTCVPVRYGSFAMITSPGARRSAPYSSIVLRTESAIVPVKRMMLLLTAGVG